MSVELRLTDNTQQALLDNFLLSPEELAKINFAMSLLGSTHSVESLQTHCELTHEQAETLAVALQLLDKTLFPENVITKPKQTGGPQSTTTLYIRNLPLTVTQEELLAAFENYGNVKEIRMQKEKSNGEFFGSVFVEYIHASAAKLAQVQMDGKLWGINTVHVSFAKEKQAAADATGSVNSIFVGGFDTETDLEAIKQLFTRFGDIINARMLTDKATGLSKGIAFIDFASTLSAAAAIDNMNNTSQYGRTIKVSYATQKKPQAQTMSSQSLYGGGMGYGYPSDNFGYLSNTMGMQYY
jgi:RNA recognition motif-containing protein